jgi:predicted nucleic acid-binding protein
VKRFVLDCSVSAAWCLQEAGSEVAEKVLVLMAEAGALVPSLWVVEMANVLVVAQRRGRIAAADAVRAEHLLRALPIQVDPVRQDHVSQLRAVAQEYGLTAYDAGYLEIAMREHLPLATLDEALRGAATKAGVELL